MYWLRGLFVLVFVMVGALVLLPFHFPWSLVLPLLMMVALFVVLVEGVMEKIRPRDALPFFVGLAFALFLGREGAMAIARWPVFQSYARPVYVLAYLAIVYVILAYAFVHRDRLTFFRWFYQLESPRRNCRPKIVDTSAIIDGRLLGVARTGFLEGELMIPRFVIAELQRIADSRDHHRRTKGRRGLDLLKELQKLKTPRVVIVQDEVPEARDVDSKLVVLSRKKRAALITTDYNLNKTAEVQGVRVLNINALAQELRPIFLPGDRFRLFVQRQGKESSQGVGYLEDGTMVVVEEGAPYIGEEIDVEVVTVLQSDTGRLIFVRPLPQKEKER
ncbi:MAG: hypothetical protein L3J76_02480 [Candidatus Hydrothermae bacterium]|nr:hypothetical protein [Candidatus Hydrothermae bacterium]